MKIEVHVYNYAGVSANSLVLAERETARIFERIGVATKWVECSRTLQQVPRDCGPKATPPRSVFRLSFRSMADKLQVGPDIFGTARLPENGGFGEVADVYEDRIRGMVRGWRFELILGRVMAHELGHLLLGENAHSTAGIMKAR